MTKLLSVAEAALALGVHRTRVNQLIDQGLLPAQKIGRAYAIQEADLELVRERPSAGRPFNPKPEGESKPAKPTKKRSKKDK